jgi:hypothetical protein
LPVLASGSGSSAMSLEKRFDEVDASFFAATS